MRNQSILDKARTEDSDEFWDFCLDGFYVMFWATNQDCVIVKRANRGPQ